MRAHFDCVVISSDGRELKVYEEEMGFVWVTDWVCVCVYK